MIDRGSNGLFHSIASNGGTDLDGSNFIFDSGSGGLFHGTDLDSTNFICDIGNGDLFHVMASSGGVDLDGSNSM